MDEIENDVEGRLADSAPGASAPVQDVDCAGYTEMDTPEEGTKLDCTAFKTDNDVHDPNETVGKVTITVTGSDPTYRFRPCRASTSSGSGPAC